MGKYVISETKNGGFSFNLKSSNGQVVATSQVYKSLEACKNGAASVAKNAPAVPVEDQTVEGFKQEKCPKFELYKDKAGEFRFRLKASNGENIVGSEGYSAKSSCLNGIESVRKNADSPVERAEKK
ncbi:MAG: YegP family protein [Sphaerochaetaceae bacterium]|nr:YegP family protein [Sphaerochaetaceae bacterium]